MEIQDSLVRVFTGKVCGGGACHLGTLAQQLLSVWEESHRSIWSQVNEVSTLFSSEGHLAWVDV